MISVHVKLISSGEKASIQIDDPSSMTMEELCLLVISSHSVLQSMFDSQDKNDEYSWLRLVCKGRILTVSSEKTVGDYAIEDGDTVYVSTKPTSQTASQKTNNASASINTDLPNTRSTGQGKSSTSNRPSRVDSASGPLRGMSEMLQNPLIQSLFENPAFLQTMLEADPRFKQMSEQNPEIAQAIRDPSFLRQMSEMMKNPALMNEAMRNQDRALANLEAIPGGYNYLSSMFSSLQGASTLDTPDPSTEEANRRMAEALGATTSPSSSGPNSQALPNPWSRGSSSNRPSPVGVPSPFGLPPGTFGDGPTPSSRPLSSGLPFLSEANRNSMNPSSFLMGNPFGFPGATPSSQLLNGTNDFDQFTQLFNYPMMIPPAPYLASQPATSTTADEAPFPYAAQLAQLESMGFTDKVRCRRALLAGGGNIEAAIAFLLENP